MASRHISESFLSTRCVVDLGLKISSAIATTLSVEKTVYSVV